MDNVSFYTQIILSVLTILGAIALRYLVPWLRVKIGKDQIENVIYWTDIFIRGAEEIYKAIPKSGEDKHDLVKKWAKLKFKGMTDAEIDIIIKALVNIMNESKEVALE